MIDDDSPLREAILIAMVRSAAVPLFAGVLAAGVACGTILEDDFEPSPSADGAAPDAATETGIADSSEDVAVDAGPPCDPTAEFGPRRPVAGLESDHADKWARLTSDEKTVLFGSTRPHVSDSLFAFFFARRVARGAPFTDVTEILGVTDLDGGTGFDSDPALSPDGLTLVFTRVRAAGTELADIFISVRPGLDAGFPPPARFDDVSSSSHDIHPFFSATGIWLAQGPHDGTYDIAYALRNADGGYAAPAPIAALNMPDIDDSMPAASRDGRTVYFGSTRPLGSGATDIWVARRSGEDPIFGAPVLVRELSTPQPEEPTWLSDDGCRLYFHAKVTAGAPETLFVAEKPAVE